MSFAVLLAALSLREAGTISRDSYGVPIIRAATESEAYRLAGYAVAQDRLLQMDRNRHLSKGRLSEMMGAAYVDSDKEVLRNGYTEAELDQQIRSLSPASQRSLLSYAQGVNDWIKEATQTGKLPEEYAKLGQTPEPWQPSDSAAIAIRLYQIFGRMSAGQIRNWAALKYLQGRKEIEGHVVDVFDDLIWFNDEDSPTTVAREDESQTQPIAVFPEPSRTITQSHIAGLPKASLFELLPGVSLASREVSTQVAMRLGVPYKTGSYAMVVAPKRSAGGYPMLLSAPQMGWSAPSIVHEMAFDVPGFKVQGMDIPGVPGIAIGCNEDIAWGLTTGVAPMEDIVYAKTVSDGAYVDGKVARQKMVMTRTLKVRGGKDVTVQVERTHLGPVVMTLGSGYLLTRRSSVWMNELKSLDTAYALDRAQKVRQIREALRTATVGFNAFYATRSGDIGYQYTGRIPIRPAGFDPRLPVPMGPFTDWHKFVPWESMPNVQNPRSGLLVNWNSKPIRWWANGDLPAWGVPFRSSLISQALTAPKLGVEDLELAAWKIARSDETFSSFGPYLRDASGPLGGFTGLHLNGSLGANAYADWLDKLRDALFLKPLGNFGFPSLYREAVQPAVILRALRGRTKFDYLRGRSASAVALEAQRTAVAARPYSSSVSFEGELVPYSNRGTYMQLIEFQKAVRGRNISMPGVAAKGPHADDQISLGRNWEYKPMALFGGLAP